MSAEKTFTALDYADYRGGNDLRRAVLLRQAPNDRRALAQWKQSEAIEAPAPITEAIGAPAPVTEDTDGLEPIVVTTKTTRTSATSGPRT